jgi:hypothetical protein
MKLQKLGGYAAIVSVCFFIVYASANIIVFQRFGDLSDPAKMMSAALTARNWIYATNLLNIACCTLAFILFMALHECMQANAPNLMRISLICMFFSAAMWITYSIAVIRGFYFFIVPTQDISAIRPFYAMGFGLTEMGYHTYGWASLLIGCAVLRSHAFSRVIGWLFLLEGILLMAETIAYMLGLISASASVIAIVWIGIAMLRQKPLQPSVKEMAASS